MVRRFQARKIDFILFFSLILTLKKAGLMKQWLLFPEKCWFVVKISLILKLEEYTNGAEPTCNSYVLLKTLQLKLQSNFLRKVKLLIINTFCYHMAGHT